MSLCSYDSDSTNVDSDSTNTTINFNINNYDTSNNILIEDTDADADADADTDALRALEGVLKEVFVKQPLEEYKQYKPTSSFNIGSIQSIIHLVISYLPIEDVTTRFQLTCKDYYDNSITDNITNITGKIIDPINFFNSINGKSFKNLTTIDLSDNNLKFLGEQISEFIPNIGPSLTDMNLSNTKLNGDDMGYIFNSFVEDRILFKLKRFIFTDNYIYDIAMITITKALLNSSAFVDLEELDLSDNNICEDSGVLLANTIKKGGLSNLRILKLSKNVFDSKVMRSLRRAFVKKTEDNIIIRCPYLESLYLNDMELDTAGICQIAIAIQQGAFPRLQHINMSETSMNSHAFQCIVDTLFDRKISLKSLDVSFNNNILDNPMVLYNAIMRTPIISSDLEVLKFAGSNISNEGIDKISELFSNGYFPSLRTISVAFNTIDPVMSAKFIASLKGTPLIEEIDMTSCNIGFNGAIALSELISSSKESKIKTLSLSHNNISSNGIKALAKAFEPSLESKSITSFSITELDLSKNYIFCDGEKALGNIVQQLPNLLILNLSDNNTNTECSEYLIPLLPKSLTYLDLSLNRMSSPNSFNLSHLDKLEYLNLSQCSISTESAKVLGDSLISCSKNLRILDLSSNDIDDEGITLISSGLNKGRGPQLRYLNLSWNRIKEEGAINFSAFILGKKGIAPQLETLNLANNKIGDFGIGCLLMALEYRYGSSDNKIGIANIRRRSHLIDLYLDNNDIGDIGVAQIGKVLSNRQSFSRFRHISLRNNLFSINGLYRMKNHFCKKGATKPPLDLIVRGELISKTDLTNLAIAYLALNTTMIY